MAQTHTLRDGLCQLAWGCAEAQPLTAGMIQYKGFDRDEYELTVRDMIAQALDAQRESEHLDHEAELVRPCFRDDPPRFPTGTELHEMLIEAARDKDSLRKDCAKLKKDKQEVENVAQHKRKRLRVT